MSDTFGPVIFSYSRAQAIDDGVLIDISERAREAGIAYPTAISRAAWDRYCEIPEGASPDQSIEGRLWDIVWMLRCAARRSAGDQIDFKLHVAMPDRGDWQPNEAIPERGVGQGRATHRLITLKAVCGPGDDAEPVITIMLPNED